MWDTTHKQGNRHPLWYLKNVKTDRLVVTVKLERDSEKDNAGYTLVLKEDKIIRPRFLVSDPGCGRESFSMRKIPLEDYLEDFDAINYFTSLLKEEADVLLKTIYMKIIGEELDKFK